VRTFNVTLAEVLLAGIFACLLYALIHGWG
jgi:hypothetical protein